MVIPFRSTFLHMTDRICHNFTTAATSYKLPALFLLEIFSEDKELATQTHHDKEGLFKISGLEITAKNSH